MTIETGAAPGGGNDDQAALRQIATQYPRRVQLEGDPIELRLMGEDDVEPMLEFARGMPPEDLLYLVANFTDESVVRSWVEHIKSGKAITVLAMKGDRVLGESTLLHNATNWTRHLGEIRIQITPTARRHGLARMLADEIDAIARQLGLQLLTARMTLDQSEAQSVFGRLGFQREAVLWDYAITRDGKTRNVVVATKRLERG